MIPRLRALYPKRTEKGLHAQVVMDKTEIRIGLPRKIRKAPRK